MQQPASSGGQGIPGPESDKPTASVETQLMSHSEAWRYTGPFTRWNRFSRAFPGLGIATVAFTGYVIFEAIFLKDSHGHGDSHGEGHH